MAEHVYGLGEKKKKSKKAVIYYLIFLCVWALVSMQLSTQILAYRLDYQQGLGDGLFTFFQIKWYVPWRIWEWGQVSSITNMADNAIMYGQWLFVIPQLLAFAIFMLFFFPHGNKKLHGSARFASQEEIKNMGYFNGQGVYVGGWLKGKGKNATHMYLRHNGPEHILCFAPTRSGKGVGLILPSLLAWQGSSIILDIKGENWALTSGYRKSIGHKVLRFDPTDTTGSSCKFNPLNEIRLNSLFAVQDVQNMAMMIVDPDGKGLNDHWTKAAFAFFSGIILHCCIMVKAEKKRTATLNDLALMLSGYEKSIQDLLDEMFETEHMWSLEKIFPDIEESIGQSFHEFIASSAMEMKGKAENEASGVVSSALVNMALYRDPIITMNTSDSDFNIHDLMNYEDPVDLYLVLSPSSIDRVRPLVRLITDMIIRTICKEMTFKDGTSVKNYKHRLLLMFDEFTSLGKLFIIEKSIAYAAGYGVKMYLIVQDTLQLDGVYGKENALMANCHVRIAYAPNVIETANKLSEMTGKTTVVEKKTSYSYGKGGRSRSVNIAETARNLMTPDECMRLPSAEKDAQGNITKPGKMLIFTSGQSPIMGDQILYFRDSTFMARAKIPVPGICETYPNGITDSIYNPRPHYWYLTRNTAPKIEEPTVLINDEKEINFEDYLSR